VHPFALIAGSQKRLPFRGDVLEARDALCHRRNWPKRDKLPLLAQIALCSNAGKRKLGLSQER
jgi:hypothetical protein